MTTASDPRLRLARKVLGDVRVIDEPGLPRRLLHVVDARGRHHIVKQHHDATRFGQETRAYATYLADMRDITACLVSQDADSRTLLLSYLPGKDCDAPGIAPNQRSMVHYRAGAALRRLHDSSGASHGELVGSGLAERMRWWTERADHAGLISRDERCQLLAWALRLSTTEMETSICHLDYQPHNWRLHNDAVYVVDFEHTRPDARVRDFARLEHRHWIHHPHLRNAFFSGYGRMPSDAEQQLLRLFGALEAVTALVRGHEKRDTDLAAHGRTLLNRLS